MSGRWGRAGLPAKLVRLEIPFQLYNKNKDIECRGMLAKHVSLKVSFFNYEALTLCLKVPFSTLHH